MLWCSIEWGGKCGVGWGGAGGNVTSPLHHHLRPPRLPPPPLRRRRLPCPCHHYRRPPPHSPHHHRPCRPELMNCLLRPQPLTSRRPPSPPFPTVGCVEPCAAYGPRRMSCRASNQAAVLWHTCAPCLGSSVGICSVALPIRWGRASLHREVGHRQHQSHRRRRPHPRWPLVAIWNLPSTSEARPVSVRRRPQELAPSEVASKTPRLKGK